MSSFFTVMLLIPACAIGAGLFSFPIATGLSGFMPGALAIILTWFFSTFSGLLIGDLSCEFYHENIHFFSLTEKLLPKFLQHLTLFSFLFICYGSLVGYLSGMLHSAHIITYAVDIFFLLLFIVDCIFRKKNSIRENLIYILCIAILLASGMCYQSALSRLLALIFYTYTLCRSQNQELCSVNNILFFPTIALYIIFSMMTIMSFSSANLFYTTYHALINAFPVLLTTFSFQLMIPSMANMLEGNKVQLRQAIIIGTSINCLIYLIWYVINIGANPIESIYIAFTKSAPITSIIMHSPMTNILGNIFIFITMLTSFMSIFMSLRDYWIDVFTKDSDKTTLIQLLIFVPVAIICLTCEDIFLWVFASTGGYGDSIAFGLIPLYMSYRAIRYHNQKRIYPVVLYFAAGIFFGIACYVQLSSDILSLMQYFKR